jgi:hypothetical protein
MVAPLPPKLIAVGWSENPHGEAKREAAFKAARAQWMARAAAGAWSVFANALAILHSVSVDAQVVETQLATSLNGEAMATNML